MRILHCIGTQGMAGTERYVSELADWQRKTDDVRVLIARQSHDPETGADIVQSLPSGLPVRAGRFGFSAALIREIVDFKPDVIHTHLGLASFRGGVLLRLWLRHCRMRPAVVATLHKAWSSRAYRRHDGLICIAGWQREEIPASFAGRVATISNWTKPVAYDPVFRDIFRREMGIKADEFLIGAGGRLIAEKGFDLILDAFRKASFPLGRLVIFGDGPEREALKQIAPPGVIFAGYRHDLKRDMSALDAFAMASLREPFGLILLEAMAAGLPVIATKAGGVPDILAQAPEWMVPPGDSDALAEGLQRLYGSKRREWNLSGFTLPEQAMKIRHFYQDCLGQHRSGEEGSGAVC
ncbi:MAG: glycosyltransferase family 4 protein [Acetobacter sp.]|jgi:glycosyltransferase involved in cell wall biosynthesis